jgi:homopolymeric O-antigen transport system permease protein
MSSKKNGLASRAFLLKEMVVRDVASRYAGSALGIVWVFVLPILWMLLYTGVFSIVLRVPTPPGFASFPEFLMAGLLPWMAIQEGIARSASALTDNASMVKKTVFPVELLVLSVVVAAAVNEVIALAIYAVYVALIGHLSLPWLALVVPALLLQILMTFGIGCIAATVTAFVRDAVQAIGILLTVALYTTPIIYPVELVPRNLRWIPASNPIAHLVEWYRRAFTLHQAPEPASILFLTIFASSVALVGLALFLRARPHFADVV